MSNVITLPVYTVTDYTREFARSAGGYAGSSPAMLAAMASADVGRDWYRVGSHFGNVLGPEHDIRIVATGKLYRIGDFTYQRLLKHRADLTPYGWLEIDEEGQPIEEQD